MRTRVRPLSLSTSDGTAVALPSQERGIRRVHPYRERAWWSTPQDDEVFHAGFQPEDVVVLADGRVAAFWEDLDISRQFNQNVFRLPAGLSRFAAFAQVDGQWRVDEDVMFSIS